MGEKKTPTPPVKGMRHFLPTLELPPRHGRQVGRTQQEPSRPGLVVERPGRWNHHHEQGRDRAGRGEHHHGQPEQRQVDGARRGGQPSAAGHPDFDVRSYGTNLLSKLLDEFASVQIIKDGSSVAVVLAEGANAPKDASRRQSRHLETKADDVKDAPVAESEGSTDGQGAAEAKPVEKKPASRRQPRRWRIAAAAGSEATEEAGSGTGTQRSPQASSMIVCPNLPSKPSLPSSLPRQPSRRALPCMRAAASPTRLGRAQAGGEEADREG